MSTFKALLITFLLLPSTAFAADSTKNLMARIQGYVDTLMNGQKATILEHKDYYSTVFLATSGRVTEVVAEDGGRFRATLVFKTTGRILQDMESQPHTVKKGEGLGEITKTVTFSVSPHRIDWHDRLESPFVKPGKEKRYLMGRVKGAASKSQD